MERERGESLTRRPEKPTILIKPRTATKKKALPPGINRNSEEEKGEAKSPSGGGRGGQSVSTSNFTGEKTKLSSTIARKKSTAFRGKELV